MPNAPRDDNTAPRTQRFGARGSRVNYSFIQGRDRNGRTVQQAFLPDGPCLRSGAGRPAHRAPKPIRRAHEKRTLLPVTRRFLAEGPATAPRNRPSVHPAETTNHIAATLRRVPYVKFDGTGETGRIMGMYIQHKMIEGAGWAETSQPTYNLRLWDDRGSWMKAPTIRSVTDMGVSLLSTLTGPLAPAINLMDDALFTMMDVSNGMDATDAYGAFGKKVLTSAVTGRISGAFATDGGLLSSTMLGDNLIGKTLTKGLELTTLNVASGAINAIDVRGLVSGNDFFNESAFTEAAFGKQAMAGVLAGMAGNFTTNSLGNVNLLDGNKLGLNSFTFNTQSIAKFNDLAGGLASSAVTYGMTGDAKFNVARLTGLGKDGKASMGLLEMNVGKSGFSMALGMGGVDISLGTIAGSLSGFTDTMKISSAKLQNAFGDDRGVSVLNAVNTMGYTGLLGNKESVALSRDIWSGKLKTRFEEMDDNGYYDTRRPGEIALSNSLRGSGLEQSAKLATAMSHEGSHANGNRVEALAHQSGLRTYAQINAILGMQGDATFAGSMVDAINDSENWKANTGERDYWKVNALKDAKGNVIGHSMTWDGSLNYDLSDIGMDSIKSDDMSEAKMGEVLNAFAAKGVKINGRNITLADLQAVQNVNTSMKAFQNSPVDGTLKTAFLERLKTLQTAGLITGNNTSQVNSVIAATGAGTYNSPCAPILGALVETTKYDSRINMNGVAPEEGGSLFEMRKNVHAGNDYRLTESNEYFAMFGGTLSLNIKDSYGLYLNLADADGNTQRVAHNGSETIMDFMNLWGGKANGLNRNNELTGIVAGSRIGHYANTGATDGAHLHLEIRNRKNIAEDTAKYLRGKGYSIQTLPTAEVYSGYSIPAGTSPEDYMKTEGFARRFFSQDISSLSKDFRKEMYQVMTRNDLFSSQGFASLPADTVNPYLKEWYTDSNQAIRNQMIEYLRNNQSEAYKSWRNLDPYLQQYYFPSY